MGPPEPPEGGRLKVGRGSAAAAGPWWGVSGGTGAGQCVKVMGER